MKTIRTQCFETNSSSTHSISIQTKKEDESKPLVVDRTLIPINLRYTSAYHRSYDGHSLHAGTVAEKVAVLLQYLSSAVNSSNGDVAEDCIAHVIDIVRDSGFEFVYVLMDGMDNPDFYNSDDDGSTFLDEILKSNDPRAAILEFFNDVVLDDKSVIIDADSPY